MKHFTKEIIIQTPVTDKKIFIENDEKELLCNIRKALDFATHDEGYEIILPKGVFYLPEIEDDVYFPLKNLKNTTINGNGAELIFSTPVPYFELTSSSCIKLENIVLDWNWEKYPLSAVGVVKGVGGKGEYVDFSYPAFNDVDKNRAFSIVGPFDRASYTPGEDRAFEFRPYENKHFHKEDKEMAKLVRELSGIFVENKCEKIDSKTLRFYTADPAWSKIHFKIGQCFNFRYFEYDGCAVKGMECDNTTLENITIYGCPGHGFLFNGDVEKIRFNRCIIMPRPGTVRSVSISVDCLHVGNSCGNIIIENCDFSFAGDDCINLHDNSSMGVEKIDEYTIKAFRVEEKNLRYRKGCLLELRNPDLSPTNFESEIVEIEYDGKNRTALIKLKDAIPDNLDQDCIIFNRSFHTNYYIIRNNRFTNNRARGALLQGSHGLVENNIFENIQGAAIQIETGAESRWSEGQGVTDLLIRNNIIRSCDKNGWQMAVIYMGVYLPSGRTNYPIFKDIEICNNTIVNIPRQAFFASSGENVYFCDNAIINAMQRELDENSYGSSQEEEPIYGEVYTPLVQNYNCKMFVCENNKVISTLIE